MDPKVLKEFLLRFLSNPLGFIKRVIYKYTLGPLKYGKGSDYQAKKYWDDRFTKFHDDFQAPGDEALSDEDNQAYYAECKEKFLGLCKSNNIDFSLGRVLEIGLGNGFYTDILHKWPVQNYSGADITDALFPSHKSRFPEFHFTKKDVSAEPLEGTYDYILLIDVIQHIVDEDKFSYTMKNVADHLNPGGYFILTPVLSQDKRHFFYLRSWSLQKIMGFFKGFVFVDIIPFKESHMILLKRPH